MDENAREQIREAIAEAQRATRSAGLDSCDTGDIGDAIEAVSQQLSNPRPSLNSLTLYLNSIARSLIGIPQARAALERLDAALRDCGLPATWEQ